MHGARAADMNALDILLCMPPYASGALKCVRRSSVHTKGLGGFHTSLCT